MVFETHSWSEDNDRGVASGWNHSRLSAQGRELAAELGERRRVDGIDVVFTSDLRRSAETAEIAFAGSDLRILHDWRLRECNYGTANGMPVAQLHRDRHDFVEAPYPDGESWSDAIERVSWFVRDLGQHFNRRRILVIGHVATRWGLQHCLEGRSLVDLMDEGFEWQLGWEYTIE